MRTSCILSYSLKNEHWLTMVTARARNQLREDYAMFEGPVMVVLWLMAPAFVGIASFGAGLAFDAMSTLGSRRRVKTPQKRT